MSKRHFGVISMGHFGLTKMGHFGVISMRQIGFYDYGTFFPNDQETIGVMSMAHFHRCTKNEVFHYGFLQ